MIDEDIDNTSSEEFEYKTPKNNFKVDCWHSEKNNGLTPRDIEKKSHKYFWFKCDVCPHDFKETIYNIFYKNKWCGYCSGRKLCDNDECEFCYNNSFASLGNKIDFL